MTVVVAGCGAPGDGSAEYRRLTVTLGSLNVADPAADVDANLKHNDSRFVGINGITCAAPDLLATDSALLKQHGLRCLEGTGDALTSSDYAKLLDQASKYAVRYNAELLRRLRNSTAP